MLPALDSFSFLVLLSLTAIDVYAGPTRMRQTGESSKFQTSSFDAKNLLGYAYWSVWWETHLKLTFSLLSERFYDDNSWLVGQKKKSGTGISIYKFLTDDETQQTSVLVIPKELWHEASLRIKCPQRGEPGHDYEKPVNWKKLGIL
ncbi:hypothetical protein EV359DRAFT_65974 [Lentinula novae-zelandiae]|nr:hypothetical protein EV359DRAFT_65974 [Lentinula novae-zelandiae]